MSEKRNRRDLINEIIEKLQFELDPRARHYIKNFSVTMRLRPPEVVLAPTGDSSNGVCGEVCSKVQCRGPYDNPPGCPKDTSTCPAQTCDQQTCTVHKCPAHSCRTVACSPLSEVSHYSSLGNADVQKSLKSKMKEKN